MTFVEPISIFPTQVHTFTTLLFEVLGPAYTFFSHISCKIYFLLLVDPFQLHLKIAIFFNLIREKKTTPQQKSLALFWKLRNFCYSVLLKTIFDVFNIR